MEAAENVLAVKSASAAIHIGFWRPETAKIGELAQQWGGTLLLSEAAIGSLPPPIAVSKASVGEVGGLAFHVALEGFGYQIDDPSHVTSEECVSTQSHLAHADLASPQGWVGQLIRCKPESEVLLRKSGIWDEESYHDCESSLETAERITLALDRYSIVTGMHVTQAAILDNLHACPHWFLDDQLSFLGLTVRMRNVCNAYDLVTIGDLAVRGSRGLLKLPNMGQGSVNSLASLLLDAFIDGGVLRRKTLGSPAVDTDGLRKFRTPSGTSIETPYLPTIPIFDTFLDEFIEAAQALTDQERVIWFARLGFGCESQTLQLIANKVGLTRERVRQIEIKIYNKIKNNLLWVNLSNRLKDHLESRTSPLLLNGISAVDPWFEGVDELKEPLREVFNNIMLTEFSVLDINDTPVITRLSLAQWEYAISTGKTLLRSMVSERLSEYDARIRIEALMTGRGAELRDELWSIVRPFALWAEKADGTRWLAGYGHTAEAVVTAVLKSAGRPLHYGEIYQCSKLISQKAHEERALHNAAQNVAVLYKRGTYGLLSQCPLSLEELALIEAEIEDIAAGADPSKQWHASELLDELLERGFDFDGQLNKYIINIALRDSKSFANMRRMVWGYKDNWQASSASRLDTRQAVMALLEEAGCPLSTLEIREKLEIDRGVNNHFQIHPQGNLIRLGTGLWGLANRDIKVSNPDALLSRFTQHLQTTQEGVHSSEILDILVDISEEDAVALLGLVKQKGMRIDRAQYIYLSSWESSRRVWPAEAVRLALDAHPLGISIEQVREEVNRITKREMTGVYISHMLCNTDGACYKPDTEIWFLDQGSLDKTAEDE